MCSSSPANDKLEQLRELLPGCITETVVDGKTTYAVDVDYLRDALSIEVLERERERDTNLRGPVRPSQRCWQTMSVI